MRPLCSSDESPLLVDRAPGVALRVLGRGRLGVWVLGAGAVLAGCGGGDRLGNDVSQRATRQPTQPRVAARERPEPRVRGCPVTLPNGDIPPGQEANPGAQTAAYLGNGALWTLLPPDGTVRKAADHTGSIVEKFPWWRGVRGRLRIVGARMNAAAPPLEARIPDGYGPTGFQASALKFPTAGCWQVRATAGNAALSFITRVIRTHGQ